MLTKTDLSRIGNLIDEKLETKLEQKLESKLEEKLESKLEEKLETKLDEKLKPIKRDIRKIKKDLDVVINTFDREIFDTKKSVTRIETHLHLSPTE